MIRFVNIASSLGEGALLFESMTATEALSSLFRFELRVLSEEPDIDLNALLGQPMTVKVTMPNDSVREFSGIVARVALDGGVHRYSRYALVLRPWFWLLTHRHNCRIHQNMTVVEIVQEIFQEHGLTDVQNALSASYRTLDYSVQYRESDFNYISRLLEEEGIYYYFEHVDGKHMLVLADGVGAHKTAEGYEKVPYFPPEEKRRERDHIDEWRVEMQVRPASFEMTDFDFERPRAALLTRRQASPSYQQLEVFDYPGSYVIADEGEQLAQVRLEELRHGQQIAEGSGPVHGLATGALFSLVDYPRQDQNHEYLVIAAHHTITEHPYETGDTDQAAGYRCSVRAIDSREPFRPARVTRRPVVEGPQTAIVVGMSGEEIWTDEHGRVKIQFHWDRYGENDENSSCWVRVAQFWAGSGFGSQFLPRIGQEVLVDFLEGDPDRPLITGRIYNGDNAWPYELPRNQTQSGIKSRSSLGGNANNANEIRLEDKKGSEEFYIQAEKDLNTLVKAAESHTVGATRAISVGSDETHTVGATQSIDVASTRTETVGSDESITIGGSRTELVAGSETVTVGGSQTITIGGSHTETVAAAVTQNYAATKSETVATVSTEAVGAAKNVAVGAAYGIEVGGAMSVTAGANIALKSGLSGSFECGSNVTCTAGKNVSTSAGQSVSIKSGEKMSLAADAAFLVKGKTKGVLDFGDQLTIKVGSAQITMKKNGDITIKGKKITLKGSGAVAIKGSKVGLN